MIVRQESSKVIYTQDADNITSGVPIAIILNGNLPPITYRLTRLTIDELANLIENGDPDLETNLLTKNNHGG